MEEITIQIPAGNLNNARWELDVRMIPGIFHKDPADFIIRCRRHNDGYLCALFNRYYEIANRVFFFEDPKVFEKHQFSLTEDTLENGKRVICLSLPDEHKGSLNYCTDYVITYEKKLLSIQNPQFFTIERHFGGVYHLGTVDRSGNHRDLGESSGHRMADLEAFGRIAAEMDAARAAERLAQKQAAKEAAKQKAQQKAAQKKLEKHKK